jgi:hypothetical protein
MTTFDLPESFPGLPGFQKPNSSRAANVIQAHEVMSDVYHHVIHVLRQDNSEPLQLMFHIDCVSLDTIPLLEALEDSEAELGFQFPQSWLHSCAEMFGQLVLLLRETAKKMRDRLVFQQLQDNSYDDFVSEKIPPSKSLKL